MQLDILEAGDLCHSCNQCVVSPGVLFVQVLCTSTVAFRHLCPRRGIQHPNVDEPDNGSSELSYEVAGRSREIRDDMNNVIGVELGEADETEANFQALDEQSFSASVPGPATGRDLCRPES